MNNTDEQLFEYTPLPETEGLPSWLTSTLTYLITKMLDLLDLLTHVFIFISDLLSSF